MEKKGGYGYSFSVEKKCLLILNRNRFSSCKCRKLQAVQRRQQENSPQFCETLNIALLAISSSNATKWVKVLFLPSKPCLFSSTTFLNSWWIQLYELQTASIDRISWAKTLKIINSKYTCNTWSRSAVAKTMTLDVNCPGLDSRLRKLFILLYFLVVFVLFSFFDTFKLLAGITSPHHSFARCCDKRIPS